MTMYVYCVYPAISKGKKQLPNCLQIAEASISALNRSFNRLLGDDRFCQGAVGGNDTASSINNDNGM
jgi:hypothetical protein